MLCIQRATGYYVSAITQAHEAIYSSDAHGTHACRPDTDILVPVFSPYGRGGIVSPFSVERNISLLMRFDYPLTDGKSLVAHHGHRLRKELIDFYEEERLEGADLGLRSTKVSLPDLTLKGIMVLQ